MNEVVPKLGNYWLFAAGRFSSGLPPIHFGMEDDVERPLLRVACQSGTLAVPPWQGDASIRVLWHIGCQGEFDELVSMSSRPVKGRLPGWERLKWLGLVTRTSLIGIISVKLAKKKPYLLADNGKKSYPILRTF